MTAEERLRLGVLLGYRDAVLELRDRWVEMHPGLASEITAATAIPFSDLGDDVDEGVSDPRLPAPPEGWNVEQIAQEYVADMTSWPFERRALLPKQIRDLVSLRVQGIRRQQHHQPGSAGMACPEEGSE